MNTLFIFGAKYLFLVPIAIFCIYFIKQKNKKYFLKISASIPLAYIFGLIARSLYYNPRPFVVENFKPLVEHVADNGFPSDHTLLVSALASVLFVFNKTLGSILWFLVIFVGFSRIYTGIHHTIDVIASILLSITATGMIYLWDKYKNNATNNPSQGE